MTMKILNISFQYSLWSYLFFFNIIFKTIHILSQLINKKLHIPALTTMSILRLDRLNNFLFYFIILTKLGLNWRRKLSSQMTKRPLVWALANTKTGPCTVELIFVLDGLDLNGLFLISHIFRREKKIYRKFWIHLLFFPGNPL